jgi:ribose transport system ATP-binding protein
LEKEIVVEVRNIQKSFPGTKVLSDVSLHVNKGEVLALMGENGAGKSTLVKILGGLYQPDNGEILINGNPITIKSPLHAQLLGINVIYQEFNLAGDLDAVENIFLGKEIVGKSGFLNKQEMRKRAVEILSRLNFSFDVLKLISQLSVVEQQGVEIARALSTNAQMIIMDEPTSALHQSEIEVLFKLVRKLRDEGMAIIFISHNLEEVKEISDRVAVLRDGKLVATDYAKDVTVENILENMIGGNLADHFYKKQIPLGDVILKLDRIKALPRVKDISFELRKGEVLGIAGLTGAGKTELAEAIFGARRLTEGTMWLDGEIHQPKNAQASINRGIGMVPEDRKNRGLFMGTPASENITMVSLDKIVRNSMLSKSVENDECLKMVDKLKIKVADVSQHVKFLSGGNQQKIILARWLFNESRIMILDEPTRGIDVNAKREVYHLIMEFLERGGAVIVISSEIVELQSLSDRILTLYEGQVIDQLEGPSFDKDRIIRGISGDTDGNRI